VRAPLALGATLAVTLLACSRVTPSDEPLPRRRAIEFPNGWAAGMPRAVFAPTAMVASTSQPASEAGVAVLQRGGNAVDAAVATGFALAVTYPEAGNLGGGGYMVIRMADGREAALDYRETAPAAATRDMFADGTADMNGGLAVAVPATVAGLAAAQERFGALSLAEVLAPAIQLAEEGFVVDSAVNKALRDHVARITRLGGAEALLPDGAAPAIGSTLRQPVLARTLRAIAEGGPAAFQRGAMGEAIAAEARRHGGVLTAADVAAYTPVWRDPLRFSYRGHRVLGMPPSSSGGITTAEALNLLATWKTLAPFGSARYFHQLASSFQRAFIDRNELLGDPAFVDVPVERLMSPGYARELRRGIRDDRATPTPETEAALARLREGSETTHFSVVDAQGNAVGVTTTTNSFFVGGFVREGGFFLNNTMDDFATRVGKPNQFGLVQGEQNAVAPGKRPLSAMSPTIVLDADGRPLMVLGSRGGPRIITSVVQVLANVLDHRMSLRDAMLAPRMHYQARPDTLILETAGVAPSTVDSLRAMGYHVVPPGAMDLEYIGIPTAVLRVRGGWEGMLDPRRGTGVVGY
jgi:gamma-glutamyltranspeptidase/glutathione hydrolase